MRIRVEIELDEQEEVAELARIVLRRYPGAVITSSKAESGYDMLTNASEGDMDRFWEAMNR